MLNVIISDQIEIAKLYYNCFSFLERKYIELDRIYFWAQLVEKKQIYFITESVRDFASDLQRKFEKFIENNACRKHFELSILHIFDMENI